MCEVDPLLREGEDDSLDWLEKRGKREEISARPEEDVSAEGGGVDFIFFADGSSSSITSGQSLFSVSVASSSIATEGEDCSEGFPPGRPMSNNFTVHVFKSESEDEEGSSDFASCKGGDSQEEGLSTRSSFTFLNPFSSSFNLGVVSSSDILDEGSFGRLSASLIGSRAQLIGAF